MQALYIAVIIVIVSAVVGMSLLVLYKAYKNGDLTFEDIIKKYALMCKIADLAADSKDTEDFMLKFKNMYFNGEFNDDLKSLLKILVIEFGKRRTNGFDFNTILKEVEKL